MNKRTLEQKREILAKIEEGVKLGRPLTVLCREQKIYPGLYNNWISYGIKPAIKPQAFGSIVGTKPTSNETSAPVMMIYGHAKDIQAAFETLKAIRSLG